MINNEETSPKIKAKKNIDKNTKNGKKKKITKKQIIKKIKEGISCIIVATVAAFLVRYYMFSLTKVSGTSMEPTIDEGDIILLDRWSITTKQEIKRGELVIIEAPDEAAPLYGAPIAVYNQKINIISRIINENKEITFIKRVIGLPGEKIEIRDGKVFANGEYIVQLSEGTYYTNTGRFWNLTVPKDCIYVLGDNRGNSTDSRNFGCIPIEKVEGKVLIRLWPITKFGKTNIEENT